MWGEPGVTCRVCGRREPWVLRQPGTKPGVAGTRVIAAGPDLAVAVTSVHGCRPVAVANLRSPPVAISDVLGRPATLPGDTRRPAGVAGIAARPISVPGVTRWSAGVGGGDARPNSVLGVAR